MKFRCSQKRIIGIAALCIGGAIVLCLVLPPFIIAILLAAILAVIGFLFISN